MTKLNILSTYATLCCYFCAQKTTASVTMQC